MDNSILKMFNKYLLKMMEQFKLTNIGNIRNV